MSMQYNLEKAEDTPAQRAVGRLRVYRFVSIGLALILIAAGIWFCTSVSVASQRALRNAKSLRIALKMLAIEEYSNGGTVFDPSQPDGLIEGGAGKLSELSDAPGRLTLTGWDKVNSDALSFTYQEGNCIVFFRKETEDAALKESAPDETDGSDEPEDAAAARDNSEWEVYLYLRVTDFS